MSEYKLFLMPIGFITNVRRIEGINLNAEEKNLLSYIKEQEKDIDDDISNDVNLSLDIDMKIKRVSNEGSTKVVISNSPDSVEVQLSEENIRDTFPWDFKVLTKRLRDRYSNFKQDKKYHKIRKKLEKNIKLCNTRYLDPLNKGGTKKNYYSPNILKEFDNKYERQAVK